MSIIIGKTYIAKDKKNLIKVIVDSPGTKKDTWVCHAIDTGISYTFRTNKLMLWIEPEESGI